MKKIFVLLVAVAAFGFAANAQTDNAIGIRFGSSGLGGSAYYNAEASFQHALGTANRLELDAGLALANESYYYIVGVYHWTFNIVNGLNWYIGPGLQLGYCTAKTNGETHGLGLAVAGQVGIEYKFDFPLMVSLDVRPTYTLPFLMSEYCGRRANGGIDFGSCFSVRYCF